jgi:hypothetical protein
MNIQRLPEYLLRWGVTIFGMALAVYLVKDAGAGGYGKVGLVLAVAVSMTALFTLRQRLWVLVPIFWTMSGYIPALPLPFGLKDLVIMGTFAAMITFRAFKVITRRPKWSLENTIALILLLYLATCWIRNPVGVQALGSDRVGGRPYFNVVIGMMACWIISQVSVSPRYANILILLICGGQMLEGVLTQLVAWVPELYFLLSAHYSVPTFDLVQDPDKFLSTLPAGEGAQRLGYLGAVGTAMVLTLFSWCRPLQFLQPRRLHLLVLLLLGLYCVLLSGFRSILAMMIFLALFSSYYWKGRSDVTKLIAIGTFGLLVLIIGNGVFFKLPYPAQRTLSFLPGRWDPIAKADAEQSTKWRVEMWEQMLTTDRYIENRVLGDGFGFRKRDLETMLYFARYGDTSQGQENFMISGNVHSGPISAIRYAGYIGLVLILTLQIVLAKKAWRLLFLARGTPFRYLAFFLCSPIVFQPFAFVFIFGAFEMDVPSALFSMGMLHMFENSLADYFGRGTTPGAVASIPGRAPVEPRRLVPA